MNSLPSFYKAKSELTILLLITLLTVIPVAAMAAVTVSADKTSYDNGDTVVATGTAPPNSAVTVQLTNSRSDLVAVAQGNADASGAFSLTVATFPTAATSLFSSGSYTVTATASGTSATATITYTGTAAATAAAVTEVGTLTVSIGVPGTISPKETATIYVTTQFNDELVDATLDTVIVHNPPYGLPQEVITSLGSSVHDGLTAFKYVNPGTQGTYAVHVKASYKGNTQIAIVAFHVSDAVTNVNAEVLKNRDVMAGLESVLSKAGVDAVAAGMSEITELRADIQATRADVGNLRTGVMGKLGSVDSSLISLGSDVNDAEFNIVNAMGETRDQITADVNQNTNDAAAGLQGDMVKMSSDISGSIVGAQVDLGNKMSDIQTSVGSISSDVSSAVSDDLAGISASVSNSVDSATIAVTQKIDNSESNIVSNMTVSDSSMSTLITTMVLLLVVVLILSALNAVRISRI